MKIRIDTRVDQFWAAYFVVRVFYLLFAVLVYGKLTTLGDTERYLTAATELSPKMLYNSTYLMDFWGSLFGKLGGNNPISNFPFMLLSFYSVRWAIKTCGFDRSINKYLLFLLISLPNFCIWTSLCSKETFGLVFSAILGCWLVNFLRGDFKFRKIYLLGIYLCGIFKPQYLPFVLQTLLFIYLASKIKQTYGNVLLILGFVVVNVGILVAVSDLVNQYASLMNLHFVAEDAQSTKNVEVFDAPYSFFYNAPLGMWEAFFGPTMGEMIKKPLHMLAGFESLALVLCLFSLVYCLVVRTVLSLKFHLLWVPALFMLFTGLAFIHYPFGIFNAGSAIRYRTNFIFMLILVAMEVYRRYRVARSIEKAD